MLHDPTLVNEKGKLFLRNYNLFYATTILHLLLIEYLVNGDMGSWHGKILALYYIPCTWYYKYVDLDIKCHFIRAKNAHYHHGVSIDLAIIIQMCLFR